MTDGSFLFGVRWRCLNSQFQDWLKIRSYHAICQISTFSYYSPLSSFFFFFNFLLWQKKRPVLLVFNFQQLLLGSQGTDKTNTFFFLLCFAFKMCVLLSHLADIAVLSSFKYLLSATKESLSMPSWPEMFGLDYTILENTYKNYRNIINLLTTSICPKRKTKQKFSTFYFKNIYFIQHLSSLYFYVAFLLLISTSFIWLISHNLIFILFLKKWLLEMWFFSITTFCSTCRERLWSLSSCLPPSPSITGETIWCDRLDA